ncbi:MAG: Amuc_1098 family type IV pilus outer membrane protein [Luteolibacter sp.]
MPAFLSSEISSRCLALALPALLATGLHAQEGSSLASREIARRQAAVQEGQMLLQKGDEAYKAGKFEEASAAYSGARESFPDSPATADLRDAATQRYAQASVEVSKLQARKGDVAGARLTMEKVIEDTVAPDDPMANTQMGYLDDPVRTNPSITKEHAADIDQVRRLLYTAEGAYDLGKYNQAQEAYKEVLRLDPYNTAARRGMEKVAATISSYHGSSYDHTRAEMFAEIDGGWELPLSPKLDAPVFSGASRLGLENNFVPVSQKISRIMIPEFRIVQGNLTEALDLVRVRAAENDTVALDPKQRGVNIAMNLGDAEKSKEILAQTFDLELKNIPLDKLLGYIAQITGTRVKTDQFAVSFIAVGRNSEVLETRTYRVPPDFMSNITAGVENSADASTEDIFNTDTDTGGLLVERIGAREALELQGVEFPEGASASFNAATNTLRIINTPMNLDIIEQIVESVALTEPVLCSVRVTMIEVQQTDLEELGFDWLLDNFGFDGDHLNLTGGTTGNGSAITDVANAIGSTAVTNPITAGNRSGDIAIADNTIDTIIAAGTSAGVQESNRAPGIIGLNGTVGGATIQALLRGLEQKKGVDIMIQPSVTTRSGQAASIKVVREFIYPTEYEPPELPNSVGVITGDDGNGNNVGVDVGVGDSFPVTPATPTAFETKDIGVTLDVLPVADANKRFIDITLNPVLSEFDGFVNYGSPIATAGNAADGTLVSNVLTENAILMPVFSKRSTNSNLIVADGATLVIGGLMKDEITTVNDKTPILGDIPVIGRFFNSNVREHTSTAILFLVNVELVDPTGRPYRAR